ncbi:hypothetical protein HK414_13050 [Ramlibacter terrae]|uniref:Uncharacterized protein n=1 Tax=Ramlibacter terrae TaxID=2732511 RepID=A0ABX6P2T8_9BURK|nr:hypothetical protein HK414_13050 [Ramlibacter terrae]
MTNEQTELQRADELAALRLKVQVLDAQQQAMRLVLVACVTTSPEAAAMLQRARPVFVQSLRGFGVTDPLQLQCGADFMEGLALAGEAQKPRSLPEFVRRLAFDTLATVEAVCRPSRWSWRTALGVAGVASAVFLLA